MLLDLAHKIILSDMEEIYRSRKTWDELKDSNIYVSGATGMIASYFVLFLIYLNEKANFNVNIYAGMRRKEKAFARFGFFAKCQYFHIVEQDLNSKNLNVFEDDSVNFDYIVHAGSLASPQYYGSYPVEVVLPNVLGTYKLLEYTRNHKVKSFLFVSSGSVYGNIEQAFDNYISENKYGTVCFLEQGNFYAESKRMGEVLAKSYCVEYGVPTKSARIFHTFGPSVDYQNDTRVFSEFVKDILADHDIEMKSDGSAVRSFCYLTDTISGLCRILLDGENGESYNIGNKDNLISIRDLAYILVSMYPEKELKVTLTERKNNGYLSDKIVKAAVPNCNKLENLGWKCNVGIKEAFSRTINYFIRF